MPTIGIPWWAAHPARLAAEMEAMTAVAPDLVWSDEVASGVPGGGWRGACPIWPFDRPEPAGLDLYVDGRSFQIEVRCSPAHPVAVPAIYPVDPVPDLSVRTRQAWHVMGDGSLCLVQHALDWTGRDLVCDLVRKAAGWFLEYLLLTDRRADAMTVAGIVDDDCRDNLLAPLAA